MAEELLGQKEPLPPVNEWRDVIHLPVVAPERPWNLDTLEDIIFSSVKAVTEQALKENNGAIFTTLSGGVDSTLCLAMISEIVPPGTPIHTFTIGGSEKHPDIQYARVAARLFNTQHHELIQTIDTGQYETAYQFIAQFGTQSVIAHDGIDELMGGYWPHCNAVEDRAKQVAVFEDFWHRLAPEHLLGQEQAAKENGIKILLPYLQKGLVKYISHIPVEERSGVIIDPKTEFRMPDRKKPLRAVARRYFGNLLGLRDIPDRQKRGFIDAFCEN